MVFFPNSNDREEHVVIYITMGVMLIFCLEVAQALEGSITSLRRSFRFRIIKRMLA